MSKELTLDQLKNIAVKLNYQHHHNIGAEKLKEGLTKHAEEVGTTIDAVAIDLGYLNTPTSNVNNTPDNTTLDSTKTADNDNDLIERLRNMTFTSAEAVAAQKSESEATKEANRLIRVSITCNNKNKASYQGEIFTVRNAKTHEIKKMIPFNVPVHVPLMMLNMIKEKQYQVFHKTKDRNGNIITNTRLVPEYNVQELGPIPIEEFNAIKQKQLAEGFTGE